MAIIPGAVPPDTIGGDTGPHTLPGVLPGGQNVGQYNRIQDRLARGMAADRATNVATRTFQRNITPMPPVQAPPPPGTPTLGGPTGPSGPLPGPVSAPATPLGTIGAPGGLPGPLSSPATPFGTILSHMPPNGKVKGPWGNLAAMRGSESEAVGGFTVGKAAGESPYGSRTLPTGANGGKDAAAKIMSQKITHPLTGGIQQPNGEVARGWYTGAATPKKDAPPQKSSVSGVRNKSVKGA